MADAMFPGGDWDYRRWEQGGRFWSPPFWNTRLRREQQCVRMDIAEAMRRSNTELHAALIAQGWQDSWGWFL
jgi:hypothetical protein